MRRFLLDNDGSNVFWNLSDDWRQDIDEAVAECPDNVTTYLLCAGAGTLYYPTEVGIVAPNAARLGEAHAAGGDPFGELVKKLRSAGKETFVTLRMNDVHDPDAADSWNTPKVRREHPDCVVDAEAIRRGNADWMSYCLDYGRPEVREYFLAVIRELAARYEFDGLQLDWMRFPRHLSGRPDEVWAKREVITAFVADVRSLLAQQDVRLAARIPTSRPGCRFLGLDVGAWTRARLVDFLVASPFLTTDFVVPLAEIRAEMGAMPVPLYAAFEFNHAAQNHCPESLRAACTSLYACGADGVYLFNFPCWTEYLGARPYHWLDGLDNPERAARKPLLFSVSHRRHRIPNVDLPATLPLAMPPGGELIVNLWLPEAALPARRGLLLVHGGAQVAARVNDVACTELPNPRRELFLEFVDDAGHAEQPSTPLAPHLFRAQPEALRAGDNTIVVTNGTDGESSLGRVNLGIW